MKTPEMKQQEAADRAKRRSTLSLEEQLALCDTRPGNSAKERARLQLAIASHTKKSKKKEVEES